MFSDLREYINQVKEFGELKVIAGADWDLEIGAITDWQTKPNSPLLLFDKVKDYKAGYRVVVNLAATARRIALLLGLPETEKPMEFVKAWRDKTKAGFKPVPPIEVKTGPIKENIHIGDDVNLFEFPAPRWHELDGGRYIGTGNMVIMRDPDEGWVNLGTYRVQIQDKNTATIYMADSHHGNIICRKYWNKGLNCPTAISCGQDPQLWFASTSQIPWGVSEYDYCGWMRGKPIEVTRGETTDLPIPATAEIVLEGELVLPETETRIEGPFGEFTGYYAGGSLPLPALRVKSILHRNEPILMGVSPFRIMPLYHFGRMITRSANLWDQIDGQVVGVTGAWIEEQAAQDMAVIAIKQLYTGHAKQAAMAALSLVRCKYVIVVDDDIDPSDISEVLWAMGTRCNPEDQIDIIRDGPGMRLDPILSPEKRARGEYSSSTAIIIACKPYHWIKDFPPAIIINPEYMKKTKQKWQKLLE
ncbi:UbiD family decarboxylase [Chloroflexota bacterium]